MDELRRVAHPIAAQAADLDPILERIGDAPIVMLGEATHGTHDFYATRAALTRRLIEEKGFGAVIVEGDWPDAYRVNRFVRGESDDRTAHEALSEFVRFPTWMWRNDEVVSFIEWLRAHNDGVTTEQRAGFYGMDLYALYSSISAVIRYLEDVDPEAAKRASARYACFGHYGGEAQAYGHATGLALTPSCEQAAVAQLLDLRFQAEVHVKRGGHAAADAHFFAEECARLVKNAEQYYRALFSGHINTWNLRDRHMMESIEALRDHLRAHGRSDRVVVWAHNSHIGDARATDSGMHGQLNIGQLARERHGDHAVLVGFTTYEGTVTAASRWDGPAERKRVRPAFDGSWEQLLHDVGLPRFAVVTRGELLSGWKLGRAIGVIYLPRSERLSHYFHANLGKQFDVVIHLDHTHALKPLERWPAIEGAELDETYPFGV
jgi:erythromycin esterase-like protein